VIEKQLPLSRMPLNDAPGAQFCQQDGSAATERLPLALEFEPVDMQAEISARARVSVGGRDRERALHTSHTVEQG
jgi:hypothetical protein